MRQLDDIIQLSTSEETPLAVLLRKMLVLSYRIKNQRLTAWVNSELDGYDSLDDLPDYRILAAGARGSFAGPFGAMIKNKPLPAFILHQDHRHWGQTVRLTESVASIEGAVQQGGGRKPWPGDLVMLYQEAFIKGYALAEAWQDLPKYVFTGVVDAVRTRTLRFALELQEELGELSDVSAVAAETVEKTVTNIIYGGNNVIGGSHHRFGQTGSMTVGAGNQTALTVALAQLGFTSAEIAELLEAMQQDKAEEPKSGIGKRAATWLGKIGTAIGTAALSVGADAAKIEATRAIQGYLGLG